jgi:hypothetical protein
MFHQNSLKKDQKIPCKTNFQIKFSEFLMLNFEW